MTDDRVIMKLWEFNVTLIAGGETPGEAWDAMTRQIQQHLPPREEAVADARDCTKDYGG